jgi:hypothetical protein
MKMDSNVDTAQEYETREILTPSHLNSYSPDLVGVLITTVFGALIIVSGVVATIKMGGSIGSSLIGIIFFIFFSFITGWPLVLSLWYREVSQKVIISTKGIMYSNFWNKIECLWKDFLIIEVVTHKETENYVLISSWQEYEFITLKPTFR